MDTTVDVARLNACEGGYGSGKVGFGIILHNRTVLVRYRPLLCSGPAALLPSERRGFLFLGAEELAAN